VEWVRGTLGVVGVEGMGAGMGWWYRECGSCGWIGRVVGGWGRRCGGWS